MINCGFLVCTQLSQLERLQSTTRTSQYHMYLFGAHTLTDSLAFALCFEPHLEASIEKRSKVRSFKASSRGNETYGKHYCLNECGKFMLKSSINKFAVTINDHS